MDDEIEIRRLWKIRKLALKLCHDRGYLVSQTELDQTLDDFIQKFGDRPSEGRPSKSDMDVLVGKPDDVSDQVFIFFPDHPKIGIKPVKNYFQRMEQDGVSRGIIVISEGLTPSAKQALNAMAPRYVLEMFTDAEILVNITEHKLVPKHTVLTPQEKQDLLSKYKVTDKQLPRIKLQDPVARYYGLKRGQVVKIIRMGETAGEYVTYRMVD
jgi:DNA-directed RNA polymerase I, II, and III subunit RPABC1